MENREWARTLQRRLNDHGVDIELLALEAASLFEAEASQVHKRWLALELHGYGTAVDHALLHQVLGVGAGDRLESLRERK